MATENTRMLHALADASNKRSDLEQAGLGTFQLQQYEDASMYIRAAADQNEAVAKLLREWALIVEGMNDEG